MLNYQRVPREKTFSNSPVGKDGGLPFKGIGFVKNEWFKVQFHPEN
jgi:hypothetical protein